MSITRRQRRRLALVLCLWMMLPARAAIPGQIPLAYQNIAREQGVPSRILFAIALQESKLFVADALTLPWPWTINVEGSPARFHTAAETLDGVNRALAAGITNIDVGLMQINLGYHRHRFASVAEAVHPYRNIAVGAQILKEEYEGCEEDWWCAVGRYHTRNPERATRYRESVRGLWKLLDDLV